MHNLLYKTAKSGSLVEREEDQAQPIANTGDDDNQSWHRRLESRPVQLTALTLVIILIGAIISSQFKKKGMSTLFTIGILNGLLPCGFVYIGLAGSTTTGSIIQGSLFMALFGIGTFPAMLSMSVAPRLISLSMRKRITRSSPYLSVTFGIYLIYRGITMGYYTSLALLMCVNYRNLVI